MNRMTSRNVRGFRLAGAALLVVSIAACENGAGPFRANTAETDDGAKTATKTTKTGQTDIEAPELFEITEAALWDGRPSLGGIWVAHPDVTDPHRVIIRNATTEKSVVGALFRRERDIPGPRIQASSEAAEALGMLAGAPVKLQVTALTREPAPQEAETKEPETAIADTAEATAKAETDAATDLSEPATPEEKKFRWPWSKPRDAATEPLGTTPEITESALDPIDEAALTTAPHDAQGPGQTILQLARRIGPADATTAFN